MPKKKTIQAEQFELPTIADHLNESDTQVPSEQAAESDYSQADIDAAHARAFQIYKTFSGKDFSSGTYKKKSPARLRVTKDGPPLTLRKKVSVSGASTPPAVRKARLNKLASSSSMSPATSPKAITTSNGGEPAAKKVSDAVAALMESPLDDKPNREERIAAAYHDLATAVEAASESVEVKDLVKKLGTLLKLPSSAA